jgi:hypothetical protein
MFIELKLIEEVCWNFPFSSQENVNSSSSLGCFKVPPLSPSEGDIVEFWVNDPSHHRHFKNVIKHSSADGPIVQNGLYRSWVLCCCSVAQNNILRFAMEFNICLIISFPQLFSFSGYLNYFFCMQTKSMSVIMSVFNVTSILLG